MRRSVKKGITGILVSLVLITSIAVVIPVAMGVTGRCISGYKLDNATGAGLAGWTINVTNGYGNLAGQNETNESGYWQICGLAFTSTYNVTEVLQPGWTRIEPAEGFLIVKKGDDDVCNLNFTNEKLPEPGTGTPGYWKNHLDAWPVENITIGNETINRTYNVTEAIATMSMPDGDKTYTMFRALVCAKLNVWIGNNASCIADTITAADEWMAAYGPAGSEVTGDSDAWEEGEPLYELLDDYNNGELCALSRDTLEEKEETETSEFDSTEDTTTQKNGKGKNKPNKPKK